MLYNKHKQICKQPLLKELGRTIKLVLSSAPSVGKQVHCCYLNHTKKNIALYFYTQQEHTNVHLKFSYTIPIIYQDNSVKIIKTNLLPRCLVYHFLSIAILSQYAHPDIIFTFYGYYAIPFVLS